MNKLRKKHYSSRRTKKNLWSQFRLTLDLKWRWMRRWRRNLRNIFKITNGCSQRRKSKILAHFWKDRLWLLPRNLWCTMSLNLKRKCVHWGLNMMVLTWTLSQRRMSRSWVNSTNGSLNQCKKGKATNFGMNVKQLLVLNTDINSLSMEK